MEPDIKSLKDDTEERFDEKSQNDKNEFDKNDYDLYEEDNSVDQSDSEHNDDYDTNVFAEKNGPQLRRQKWGLQKRRRKHRRKLFGRTAREWCRFFTEWLIFYTTFFFVLLAIFSIFSLLFLVPFFIDPAWSTLQADFDPKGTNCSTISGQYVEGI